MYNFCCAVNTMSPRFSIKPNRRSKRVRFTARLRTLIRCRYSKNNGQHHLETLMHGQPCSLMKRARLDRTAKIRSELNRQAQCAWLFLTRVGRERLVAKNRRVSPAKSLMPGGLVGASVFRNYNITRVLASTNCASFR